jgi:hypothetical protein
VSAAAPFDVQAFRAARRALPLLDHEIIENSPAYLSKHFRRRLEERLDQSFTLVGFTIPSLDPPIDWFAHNRSFAYHLAAWNPIGDFLIGYSKFADPRFFAKAWNYARAWLGEFQVPAFAIGPDPKALTEKTGPTPWYDMAAGQRIHRLAYMLDVIARDPAYADANVGLLHDALRFHLTLMESEDFFRARNNHGLYQSLGELAATRRFRDLPGLAERHALAKRRVAQMIDQQFHMGGIHREHSPGYHYLILFTLIGAWRCGMLEDPELDARIARLEEVFTWLIQGNGELLTIGDTDPREFARDDGQHELFRDPGLRWHFSAGLSGTPPPEGLMVLRDEGYVFARGAAPKTTADPWWHFGQIAAFHSRTHKHADDLSFVWADRGAEILIDPARYGYAGKTEIGSELHKSGFWYADPKRVYVESTRAHNTVEIDGKSYDRMRKPYGSALLHAGRQGDLIVTECEVHHFRTVRHWRAVALKPGHFLLAIDWLYDRSGAAHDFRSYFHFHPAWTLTPEPEGHLSARRAGPDLTLNIVPLAPAQGEFGLARGREEPGFLGWYSDRPYSLTPSTSISAEQLDTSFAVFATLFTFAPDAVAAPAQTSILRSMRPSRFAWSESGETLVAEVMRGEEGVPVSIKMTRAQSSLERVMTG